MPAARPSRQTLPALMPWQICSSPSAPRWARPGAGAGTGADAAATVAPTVHTQPLTRQPTGRSSIDAAVDCSKYIGFEDLFRGPRDEIRGRLADYLPLFAGAANVLDLGCGRGEFLELLREEGIEARGVDLNDEMVELCRTRGLDVVGGDALTYLEACPDGSIGGILAAQVIEHLDPAVIIRLLDVAHTKLTPGGRIVLETINPACWFAFFESYIRDLTHVRPVHPDTLKFLLQASGFQRVEIRYRAPFPEGDKLQPVSVPSIDAPLVPELPVLKDLAMTFNANIDKLNGLLFTHLDYAAIGERI
jgi:O-antigen chain-terminating methyltransferase